VRRRVDVLGDQVADLYEAASSVTPAAGGKDEVRILHVSDIHSNPLGLEVTRRLAEHLDVDAVLDTGDLTSFGLPIEGRLGELIADVPVPYYFVAGNHDSAPNRAALAGVANLRPLEGTVADVRGVRILGIADPTFTADNQQSSEAAAAEKRAAAPAVAGALAVHDPLLGEAAWGRVPLVVAGHVHRPSALHRSGTLVLTVGSTGSTGLGSFTVDTGRPYEAQILRFTAGRLISVDRVALRGVGGAFRVERQLITSPAELAEVPHAPVSPGSPGNPADTVLDPPVDAGEAPHDAPEPPDSRPSGR
jgi:predicted phosphodiesterase